MVKLLKACNLASLHQFYVSKQAPIFTSFVSKLQHKISIDCISKHIRNKLHFKRVNGLIVSETKDEPENQHRTFRQLSLLAEYINNGYEIVFTDEVGTSKPHKVKKFWVRKGKRPRQKIHLTNHPNKSVILSYCSSGKIFVTVSGKAGNKCSFNYHIKYIYETLWEVAEIEDPSQVLLVLDNSKFYCCFETPVCFLISNS